MIKKVLHLKKL